MNHQEFVRRVSHNTKVLKDTIAAKEPIINILPKIYTYDTEPGELSSATLLRKGHDILPASYLGLLASTNGIGVDAFKILGNNHKAVYELKTSEINSNHIKMGPKGGLFKGVPGKKSQQVVLGSALNAAYSLHTTKNIISKNITTIFLISDSIKDGYIDAFELDGETVVEYLTRKNNQNRTIKLCTFMNHGKRANTVVDLIGFDAWKDSIISKLKNKN